MGDLIDAKERFGNQPKKVRIIPIGVRAANFIAYKLKRELIEDMKIEPRSTYFAMIGSLPMSDQREKSLEEKLKWWKEDCLPNFEWQYDSKPEELKRIDLTYCITQLHRENPVIAREYIYAIDDPYLAADVLINLNEDVMEEITAKNEQKPLQKGSFWQNLEVMKSNYQKHRERELLRRKDPQIYEGIQGAIAAIIVNDLQEFSSYSKEGIEIELKKYLELFHPSTHEGIVDKIKERKWISLDQSDAIQRDFISTSIQ
jgi:hypothetical protein